jgi:lysophospholipase L1-like esterase
MVLLVSSVLTLGVAESAFRVFAISYPELSADLVAADQSASEAANPKRRGDIFSGSANAPRDPGSKPRPAALAPGERAPASAVSEPLHVQMARMINGAFRTLSLDSEMFEENRTRVLFLGDSFTQGAGLDNLDDRFSNVLARRINDDLERAGGSDRVDIFNGGIGGSNPVHWIRYFQRIVPTYKPHIVFAIFFLRDGAPIPTSLFLNRAEIDPIRAKFHEKPGYSQSAVLRFLYNKLAWREYGDQFKRRLIASYVGTPEQTVTWRQRRPALLQIARACQSMGIPFHLVIFPILLNLDDYEFSDVEDEISRFAQSNGIPVFSLTSGFLGKDDRSLWVSPVNQHPNADGHRIAADTLQPYLRDAIARPVRSGLEAINR